MASTDQISRLASGLRSITAQFDRPRDIIPRVRDLVAELCKQPDWLQEDHFACDEEQGFGVHVLHEEDDHSLAVFALAWLPGRGVAPHNHGTWTVVGGVHGIEHNINWLRTDDGDTDGFATIERSSQIHAGPGQVMTFLPDDIHSVTNQTDEVTVSLHVYGMHVNHTNRFQYDPDTNAVDPLKLKID